MSDVLSEIAEDISITRADLRAGGVMLIPPICTMGEDAHFAQYDLFATLGNGRHLMMGDDPRLPKMPAQPRLADFFRHRFVPMAQDSFRLGIHHAQASWCCKAISRPSQADCNSARHTSVVASAHSPL